MKRIGTKGKVLGEVLWTPNVGPRASLSYEGKAVQRELMRVEWLLSKSVLPVSTTTESWSSLPRGSPVEGVPTEGWPIGSS